jgi:hypothetical protein
LIFGTFAASLVIFVQLEMKVVGVASGVGIKAHLLMPGAAVGRAGAAQYYGQHALSDSLFTDSEMKPSRRNGLIVRSSSSDATEPRERRAYRPRLF